MSEWEVDERMPRFDDVRVYDVWMHGTVRKVKRAGNHSIYFSPGTLVFLDCNHPLQNVLCDEDVIDGWRLSSEQPKTDVAKGVSAVNDRHWGVTLQSLLYGNVGIDQAGYGY